MNPDQDTADGAPAAKMVKNGKSVDVLDDDMEGVEAKKQLLLAQKRWNSFHDANPGVFSAAAKDKNDYLTYGTLHCECCGCTIKVGASTGNVGKHIAAPRF
jgi:hypothetical protein